MILVRMTALIGTMAAAWALTSAGQALAQEPVNYTVSISGEGTGKIDYASADNTIRRNCQVDFPSSTTCQITVDAGTVLTFVPSDTTFGPSDETQFSDWGGACEGASPDQCVVEVNADTTIVANFFSAIIIDVQEVAGGSGTVEVIGTDLVADSGGLTIFGRIGDTVALRAVPRTGDIFIQWSQRIEGPGTGCAVEEISGNECAVVIDIPTRRVAAEFRATNEVTVVGQGD